MKQIVVTNLRIPQGYWPNVKAAAGEAGQSVNQYIFESVMRRLTQESLSAKTETKQKRRKKQKNFFEALAEIAKMPNKPMGELSEDDQIIYGLK